MMLEPEPDTAQTHEDILESPSASLAVPTAQDTADYSFFGRVSARLPLTRATSIQHWEILVTMSMYIISRQA